jgi:hypothetical protein
MYHWGKTLILRGLRKIKGLLRAKGAVKGGENCRAREIPERGRAAIKSGNSHCQRGKAGLTFGAT